MKPEKVTSNSSWKQAIDYMVLFSLIIVLITLAIAEYCTSKIVFSKYTERLVNQWSMISVFLSPTLEE